jgi:hypothetical protein
VGFFKRFNDAMNEEFIIGDNVRRYEADPSSLDDILNEQRARGFGSQRGLREHATAVAAQERGDLIEYRPSAYTARERVVTRPDPQLAAARRARRAAREERERNKPSMLARVGLGLAAIFAGTAVGYALSNNDD